MHSINAVAAAHPSHADEIAAHRAVVIMDFRYNQIDFLFGIGPADLPIGKLIERVEEGEVQEVILALSTSMEGETTSFFLYKKLSALNIKISTIARGVGFGDDLEYTDELTLGKSIQNRHLFKL